LTCTLSLFEYPVFWLCIGKYILLKHLFYLLVIDVTWSIKYFVRDVFNSRRNHGKNIICC
jgi:hypothetical protein